MNKSGKKSNAVTFGVIALVAILAVLVYAVGFRQQTALGGGDGDGGSNAPYISTGAATLSINAVDALQEGTAVSSSSRVSKDGAAFQSGITTASPNQKLNILLINGTTYHNTYVTDLTVPRAPTMDIPAKLNGNGTVTMTIFTTDDVVMTNGGGASNQTSSVGATYNHKIKLQGTDKKNSQDMRCIIETTSSANTTNILLTGFGAVQSPKGVNSKPNWYTVAGTGSGVYVYDIQPIVGAETKEGTVVVTSQTGKSLSKYNVIVTCKTKEWFLDSTTGKVMYDVEDSLGNLQSIAGYTYTFSYT